MVNSLSTLFAELEFKTLLCKQFILWFKGLSDDQFMCSQEVHGKVVRQSSMAYNHRCYVHNLLLLMLTY